MSGAKKSLHDARNGSTVIVMKTGVDNGTMILKKIHSELAPSILAASSSSFGMLMKNCRNKKTANALPANQCGTTSGLKLSSQPRYLNSRKLGTIVTWGGNINVLRTSKKIKSRRGNLNRAKP